MVPNICFEDLMKATQNFLYDGSWAGILTPGIPEYEQGMLTTTRRYSVPLAFLDHVKYWLESLTHFMKCCDVGNIETVILHRSFIRIRRYVLTFVFSLISVEYASR
jgi:hypothetical protein